MKHYVPPNDVNNTLLWGIVHCYGVNTCGRFGRPCCGHDVDNIFS
jgi:hypothetical protein